MEPVRRFAATIVFLTGVLAAASAVVGQPASPPPPSAGPVQPKPSLPTSGPTWQSVTPGRVEPVPVQIEPDVLDLGDLPPNTQVQGEFKITNVGSEPLRIKAAMSTCACTVAQLGETEITPGRAIILPVTFDSGKVLANQEREVVIRFDGYSRPAAARVRASTNYGVRTTVVYDPPDQRRLGVVTLEGVNGHPFRVMSAHGKPPVFVDDFEPGKDVARSAYKVQFDLTGPAPEQLPRYFVIELDHPSSPIIDIPVENLEFERERTLRPWSFSDKRTILGTLPPLSRKDVVVTLQNVRSGGLDLIQNLWVEPPTAEVAILGMEQTETGLNVRLRVAPRDDVRGALVASVFFSGLDHEDSMTLMARIAEPGSAE
jgi:hypothetical protein